MVTRRSRVMLCVTLGMLVTAAPATAAFAAEVPPPPALEAPIGASEEPVYPVPSPLEAESSPDWHPLPTPAPAQPPPVFQAPPPLDLTSELEAAWAANHPPGSVPDTVQASGGGRSAIGAGEPVQSAEPAVVSPAVVSPVVAAPVPRVIPSEADLGLWLRVEPRAVRAAPDSARSDFVLKGEIDQAIEERRSATAGLTRTSIVAIGALLALGAVVVTVVLPGLRIARRT